MNETAESNSTVNRERWIPVNDARRTNSHCSTHTHTQLPRHSDGKSNGECRRESQEGRLGRKAAYSAPAAAAAAAAALA